MCWRPTRRPRSTSARWPPTRAGRRRRRDGGRLAAHHADGHAAAARVPAAAQRAVGRADHALRAAEEQVRRAEARDRAALGLERVGVDARLAVDDVRPPSARAARRSRPAASIPSSTMREMTCRIAERMRLDPADPRPTSTSPSRRTIVGDIIDGSRRPGGWREEAERREVLLAHHVVEVQAGAGHDDARALAVGRGHRARPAVGVDHGDVGRRAEPLEELRRPPPLRVLQRVDQRRAGAPGSASSSSSAAAIRMPPADGGGLVTTSRPR